MPSSLFGCGVAWWNVGIENSPGFSRRRLHVRSSKRLLYIWSSRAPFRHKLLSNYHGVWPGESRQERLEGGVIFRQHIAAAFVTKDRHVDGRGEGNPNMSFLVVSDVYICYELHDLSKVVRFGHNLIARPPPFLFTFVVTLISSWLLHLCWVNCLVIYFEMWFFSWAGRAPGNLIGFFLGLL